MPPWAVDIVRNDGSTDACGSRSNGGSEGRRNKVVDVNRVICVRANCRCINWRVHWWDMTEKEVGVPME